MDGELKVKNKNIVLKNVGGGKEKAVITLSSSGYGSTGFINIFMSNPNQNYELLLTDCNGETHFESFNDETRYFCIPQRFDLSGDIFAELYINRKIMLVGNYETKGNIIDKTNENNEQSNTLCASSGNSKNMMMAKEEIKDDISDEFGSMDFADSDDEIDLVKQAKFYINMLKKMQEQEKTAEASCYGADFIIGAQKSGIDKEESKYTKQFNNAKKDNFSKEKQLKVEEQHCLSKTKTEEESEDGEVHNKVETTMKETESDCQTVKKDKPQIETFPTIKEKLVSFYDKIGSNFEEIFSIGEDEPLLTERLSKGKEYAFAKRIMLGEKTYVIGKIYEDCKAELKMNINQTLNNRKNLNHLTKIFLGEPQLSSRLALPLYGGKSIFVRLSEYDEFGFNVLILDASSGKAIL